MVIVHQNKDMATKLEDICYRSEWSDDAKREIIRIQREIREKEYNYGSTDRCNTAIEEEINVYKEEHPEDLLWVIYINGVSYGEFSSEWAAKQEFYQILNALSNEEKVYQISRSNAW